MRAAKPTGQCQTQKAAHLCTDLGWETTENTPNDDCVRPRNDQASLINKHSATKDTLFEVAMRAACKERL